ncbi:hypothetical protein [Pelomonas sp. Root1444]|uniref:hypothetical protein n=1 Tax=Pelomonas sp. Root1444 TaxID=1736464 RepID=UPI000702B668|nr:hypothetical protein [Pelomonas sp. Root1444]KQY80906.1 hypothetical protein ASD35_03405 [Pelomonas sp. Root1444]
MSDTDEQSAQALPETSMPQVLVVDTHGIDAPEAEAVVAEAVRGAVEHIGRMVDLSTLDGVTVAADHGAAIKDLDRGHPDLRAVSVTNGNAVGMGMTVMVVREGQLRSHIFLGLQAVAPLVLPDRPSDYAAHLIAHECTHVEVTARFDRCFPGHLLNRNLSVVEEIRWDVALGCIDEYLVTHICATAGADMTEPYEVLFLEALAQCPAEANDAVRAFAGHGDRFQALQGVLRAYGTLIKRAAYHLGNLDGHGKSTDDLPQTQDALAKHWLGPYILRFHEAFKRTASGYGKWPDATPFMEIAILYEELLAEVGVIYEETGRRRLWIDLSGAVARVSLQPAKG